MKINLIFLTILLNGLFASISVSDQEVLVQHFNIMQENGYVQSSVSACQPIMGNGNYNWADWDEFYWNYFHQYPPKSRLFEYLGYPMYYWFGDNIHYNHQKGMMRTLMDILSNVLENYSDNLGPTLESDLTIRNSFFICFSQLSGFANSNNSVLDESSRNEIISTLLNWVNDNQQHFLKSIDLNAIQHPYEGLVRRQAIMFLIDIEPLTTERAEYLSDLLDFQGSYHILFVQHKLYIADNNGMSQLDLNYLENIMTFLPDTLTSLRYLSNNGYFYATGQSSEGVSISGFSGSVNTFSTIGGYIENGFPSDIEPIYIDGFSVVVAHELNHRVDPDYIYIDETLNTRRAQLIEQAGTTDLNYLRSNVGGAFFQNAPQEFIASIANQWFCSSEHTLNLGLQRFDNGYSEPLNQVLYFTELYSAYGNSTQFYTVDTNGNIDMETIPIWRNENGHINKFIFDGITYNFQLDIMGNVENYSIIELLGDINEDGIINILDVVQIVNFVLNNNFQENADLNQDGEINVIDIVQLVNIILGS